jgi:hypothetical protein
MRVLMSASAHVPTPKNEPVRGYAPGSPERASVKAALSALGSTRTEVPLTIGGRSVHTDDTVDGRRCSSRPPICWPDRFATA